MTANVEHSDSQTSSWMIRTAENILSGPFTKDQVIQLIQEGKLDLTDEVCGSGHYWVFLHEEGEIKSQLGIDLPQSFFDAEESTQTESDNTPAAHLVRTAQNNPTGPIAAMGTRGSRSPTLSPQAPSHTGHTGDPGAPSLDDDDNVPELSVPADSIEEQASVLSNRAYRAFRPQGPSSPGGATRVLSMENALKESDFETANQPEPQFSGSDSYAFKDQEGTPPPIDMPRSPSSGPVHNTSLSLDPEPADWTARFWGVVAFILIAAAAVVWFFAFRKPA
jgi:hypothetical protein